MFADELPSAGGGLYAHYDHQRCMAGGWEYCDIRDVVHRHQDSWLDELVEWHRELCERAASKTDWWWTLPTSRLYVWHYPVNLKPLFFARAIIESLKDESTDTLYVIGCPPAVRDFLREWSSAASATLDLDLRIEGVSTSIASWLASSLRLRLHQRLDNFRSIIALAVRVFGHYRFKRRRVARAKLIVFSFALRAENILKNYDHYFGDALKYLPNFQPDDILWLYELGPLSERQGVRRCLESQGRKFSCYLELLGPADFLWIVFTCFLSQVRLARLHRQLPALTIGQLGTRTFSKLFYVDGIRNQFPSFELAAYRSMKRALSDSQASALLYPYEEKGIERAILRACKEHDGVVRTAGFAHAVHNRGHLYLRATAGSRTGRLRPDVILATGAAAKAWLSSESGVKESRVASIGSPRSAASILTVPQRNGAEAALRVLFPVGYGYELHMLANFVDEVPDIFAHCSLLIRPYPYSWQGEQARGAERLSRLVPDIRVEGGVLDDQLDWCEAVIFASTSAGVQAILRGRIGVHVGLHDIFEGDPTHGKGDPSSLDRCATPGELKASLERIRQLNKEEYMEALGRQQAFVGRIYSAFDAAVLDAHLSSADGSRLVG